MQIIIEKLESIRRLLNENKPDEALDIINNIEKTGDSNKFLFYLKAYSFFLLNDKYNALNYLQSEIERYGENKYTNYLFSSLDFKFNCPVCESEAISFLPLSKFYSDNLKKNGFKYSLSDFETLNYYLYSCSLCGANDRDRLYALFFKQYFNMKRNNNKLKFLDFSPSKPFMRFLKKVHFIDYISCDLLQAEYDIKADITNMNEFETEYFDFIICSHVLEHVSDDKAAVNELFRVLKKGAKAIIMVPICLSICETIEDKNVTGESGRWMLYGQNDHVRLYSKKGFLNRILSAGFKANELDVNYFGLESFLQNGINKKSVLYICEK